ncbi:peroxidase 5-like [Chenopodium quinoa]|nr:peroxidase 5-like [Chenopodium quinoa]
MESPLAILTTLLSIIGLTNHSSSPSPFPPGSSPLFPSGPFPSPSPSPSRGGEINTTAISDKLRVDFYNLSCPNVEQIIGDVVRKKSQENPGIVPGIIRLHFHDCYITGCDASILLTPQRYNSYDVEMTFPANGNSLRGLDALDTAKTEVEKQCPGVVSCADLLAYAARDMIVMSGNPKYDVPAGRRDSFNTPGGIASALPKGNDTVAFQQLAFADRGLTLQDMVVLEGSHSIGQTRCQNTIAEVGSMDKMPDTAKFVDKQFQQMERQKYCPESQEVLFGELRVPLFPDNPNNSDWGNAFYNHIMKGRGSLPFDVSLAVEQTTKDIIQRYASDSAQWQQMFNEAMAKLGKVNVLTGDQGEIRRNCKWINAVSTA